MNRNASAIRLMKGRLHPPVLLFLPELRHSLESLQRAEVIGSARNRKPKSTSTAMRRMEK
jgi:hypothetical protein